MPTLIEQQNIDRARASAKAQVSWYADHNLYYKEPPKPGRASWGIALHPHFITPDQHQTLTQTTPKVIEDFHRVSTHILSLALDPRIRRESHTLETIYQVLTFTNPPETEKLWREMLALGKILPGSSRPDILLPEDTARPFQHIEYNADGSADKGNTLGLAKVTQEVLGYPTVGIGLDKAFIQGIRHQLPQHDQITVATVLPDAYRTEYDPQNEFFSKQVDGMDGVQWLTTKVSQLKYRPDGVYVGDKKIDIVDREIKAPGFTDNHDFKDEMALYKAVLENKVGLFGSVLPHSDKLFLATIFDPDLKATIAGLIGTEGLQRLRRYHPTTHLFDPARKTYQFGSDKYSIDELRDPNNRPTVIKHTGDNIYTTGSNGVFISRGYRNEQWGEMMDKALLTGVGLRTHLIVQDLVEPQRFPVETISSTTADPKTWAVPVRFAPYYVWNGTEYELGDALVTSGTDRQVTTLNSLNIHGQRDNTPQGVAVK